MGIKLSSALIIGTSLAFVIPAAASAAAPRAVAAGPQAARAAAAGGSVPAVRVGKHANWPTYHANARRTGAVSGLPAAGPLAIGWRRALRGAVYGQPLVIGSTVIAATERDMVYGLSLRTGRVLWSRRVATPLPLSSQPCGNLDPLGITSTPVFYRGLIYIVAQNGRLKHVLVGLNPVSGRVRYRRSVPSPDHRPYYDQQRSALAAGNGRIYVTFGGHFGDCGPYIGSVVGVPAAGPGAGSTPIISYKVPSRREAGIWSPGGPVTAKNGTQYVGV